MGFAVAAGARALGAGKGLTAGLAGASPLWWGEKLFSSGKPAPSVLGGASPASGPGVASGYGKTLLGQ